MDSQNQSSKKLPSLRTYAKDLENTRKVKNLPTDTTLADAIPSKAPAPVVPRKKEPLIIATPVAPAPKIFADKETLKDIPTLKPIPAKKPLPKLPTFTAPDNTTFIVNNEDAAAATIITDTKRNRFKLFPSLFASIEKWFADQKKARAVKNTPKYTVPETTHRKGVIQRATSTTGKSATADFASIQERIKQRKAHIKKAEPHTTWSANTEPAFLLLEESAPESITTNVQLVDRKSFYTPPPPTPPVIPTPVATPTPAPTVVPVPPPPIVQPVPPPPPPPPPIVEPIVVQTPTPVTPPVTIPTEPIVVSTPLPEITAPEVPDTPPEPTIKSSTPEIRSSTKYTFLTLDTNLLSLGISGIALVLILTVTFGYVLFTKSADTTTVPTTSAALLQTSTFTRVTDTPLSRTTLITKLATLAAEDAMISEFVFADPTDVAFSPQQVISALEISMAQNFTQAIKTMHFGYVANTEPYLLMEVTDEIAARGGLLAWEKYLYTDFATMFSKKPVVQSAHIKFIDGTLSGSDVRILKNETGSEIVMYGMLNGTILITTNSRTFTDIANLIQ